MREYPASYGAMSEEAQKTGAYPVNKRTISNRLVFRLKHTSQTDIDIKKRSKKLKKISQQIYQDLLKNKLKFKRYKKNNNQHDFAHFYLEKRNKKNNNKIQARACGRITVSVHNDYVTITTTLSLGNCEFADPIDNVPTLVSAKPILKLLRKGYSEFEAGRYILLDPNYKSGPRYIDGNPKNPRIEHSGKILYNDLWNYWDKKYFGDIFLIPELEIVSDIRGLLIPRLGQMNNTLDTENAGEQHTSPPFASGQYSREVVTTLQPLFSEQNGWKYRELVGCKMFGERAIFLSPVSTIKLKIDQERIKPKVTPICFALAPHFNEVWESGRMLHRINMVATFRTLSLGDIERFRAVSAELKRINHQLHERRKKYFGFIKTKKDALEKHEDGRRKWIAGINDHIKGINEIESSLSIFKVGDMQIPLHAIEYDLYRSALVADRFKNQVRDLRVKRIEGWQPYNEYVRRRIFPLQEYTRRVSDRLQNIRSAIDELLRSALAEIEAENSEGILQINEKIYSAHKFQLLVETIAIAYYGGYALSGIIYTILRYSPFVEKIDKKFKIKNFALSVSDFSLSDKDILYTSIAVTTFIALSRYLFKSSSH